MVQNIVEIVKNNEALFPIMSIEEKTSEIAYPSLDAKSRELYALRNRLERYSNRLILEGLKNAGGINIKIERISEDYVDPTPIIELARDTLPSLYRRYNLLQGKYFQGLRTFKSLIQDS